MTKEECKKTGIKRTFYTIVLKRFFDIILSLLALVILFPFLIVFAIMNLIFSRQAGCPQETRRFWIMYVISKEKIWSTPTRMVTA